ncbi:MAG TPA: flagellar hook-length control protein FliK [Acidobacteriaceae bacterium]|nr:flagellar hook-length control protein FliK [Acidobacteriaceae bacterium]
MPHAVMVTTASNPAASGLPNLSLSRGKSGAQAAVSSTFGAFFREKATEVGAVPEVAAGKISEPKASPEMTAVPKASLGVHAAVTQARGAGEAEASDSKTADADGIGADGVGADSLMEAKGAVARLDTATAGPLPPLNQGVGEAIAGDVTRGPAIKVAFGEGKAPIAATTVLSSDAVPIAAHAGSEVREKGGSSPSAGAVRARHKDKDPASTSTGNTGPSGSVFPLGGPLMAVVSNAAPGGVTGGGGLAGTAASQSGTGHESAAIKQTGSAASLAGQSAVLKSLTQTAHAGASGAAPSSTAAADDSNSAVDATDAGKAATGGHASAAAPLHADRSMSGRQALGQARGAAGPVQAAAALAGTPNSQNAGGGEPVTLPQGVAPGGVSMHAAVGAGSESAATASPFDRLDQGVSPVVLHAGSQHVEVGVHDPQLGWVEISAQNAAGHVDARLVAASGQTHSALAAQLPAIAQYLQERDVRVATLGVQHSAVQTNAGGGQAGGQSGNSPGANTGSGGGNHSSSGANEAPLARMAQSSPVITPRVAEGASLGPISYISVRA